MLYSENRINGVDNAKRIRPIPPIDTMAETSFAYAKVNISLDIISKRSDGFHNMKMVMQTVSLSDEITVRCEPGAGISSSTDTGLSYLPVDRRNIAVKAALAFFDHTGITGYLTHINIKKEIPVSAGLGGGSADAACVLRMLDRMFDSKLGQETLKTIGKSIGSDVPFCIVGGTCLAEGRGEVLTELPPLPRCYFVICKPPFSYSTPELFSLTQCEKIRVRPDTEGLIASLMNGNLSGVARRMYNVFEDYLPWGKQDIIYIKNSLLDNGALGATMTGSGPTVVGLFESADYARQAYEKLKENYLECYLAQPMNKESLE
ncbi:MAG: 4-(cytidine 5'-diphospho)-2-C-methyl-D-erythritol kinase [Oscillospiraceae bacterium]|nr:4-(cytidine 5'-diphospho)-2-C-methyl-D-erythritol kinase [Oscillospiraceae bacterium]